MNGWSFHIIQLDAISGKTITLTIGSIISRAEINKVRKFIEDYDYENHIKYWSKKLNIVHKTITISYGPVLRDWINRYNEKIKKERKEKKYASKIKKDWK